ncbi:MAG: zf-HC2 domain-containing protein [Acidobacteriota bacterium]|nr:zf-HC2 domain-containing protein [Acidobacteriota bacterium]
MDHADAVGRKLVEQYVLAEMTPELRDEFEEHFFGCELCAADLRATSAFADAAKVELKRPALRVDAVRTVRSEPRRSIWQPAFAIYALAACLLVMLYQNALEFPRWKKQVAAVNVAEVLPSISLVGNSRGGGVVSAAVGDAKAVLLLVDIPAEDRFASYTCLLYAPSGDLAASVVVSPQQARDTVSIHVPLAEHVAGRYSLLVKGNLSAPGPGDSEAGKVSTPAVPSNGVDLARYAFVLNDVPTSPGPSH